MSKHLRLIVAVALGVAAGSVWGQSIGSDYLKNGVYDPQTPQRRGQAGMTFLEIGGSARAEAMGGAFIAVQGDPSTVFYNPAGAADIKGISFYADRTSWVADMTVNHFVIATHTRFATVGATLESMDYGEMQGTAIADNLLGYEKTAIKTPSAWVLGGFIAARFTDRFTAGVHVKYAVQDFQKSQVYSFAQGRKYLDQYEDNRLTAYLVDLGTQYNTGLRNVTINMSFQHFSRTHRFVEDRFDLPQTYHVGMSFDVFEVLTGAAHPTMKLMVYGEGVDQRDVDLDAATGLEFTDDLSAAVPGLTVALRVGRRPARNQEGWLNVGGGISVPLGAVAFSLDYSYGDYGPGLDAHRFGITLHMK